MLLRLFIWYNGIMRIKLKDPQIGDVFEDLKVKKVYSVKDKYGYSIRVVDLVCKCGSIVKKKRLGHLYGTPKKSGIKSCNKCGFINRGKSNRRYTDSQAKNAVYGRYKSSAKQRNIEWDISKEDFFSKISLPCIYCDNKETSFFTAPKSSPWSKSFKFTGLDRIDNSLGYTVKNVQPCCKWCNYAKSDRSEIDFENWILRVANKINRIRVDKD